MKVAEHIKKAAEALADMVADGHLRDDFELAEVIYLAQYGLQEAKKLSANSQKPTAKNRKRKNH